jgi:hypothetical protein
MVKQARTVPRRHGIPNIDLIRTFTGLLCLGKSDFEAVENARQDPFFKAALGIKQMPSSAPLCVSIVALSIGTLQGARS